MRGMLLIARRDLAAYLNSYWGYAVVTLALVINGILFNSRALGDKPRYSADVMQDFLLYSFGITCVASVFLTMRLVAEERHSGTIVLIDSAPLSEWQFVGGKYISGFVVLASMILISLYMPALVFVNGKVSYGHIAAGYTGLLLVAAATTAIGTFASTISRHQLVAGFISGAIIFFLVTAWWVAKVADPPLKDIFSYMSLFDRHFRGFKRGQINIEDVVYFLSLAGGFLALSSRFMNARRWR